MSFMDIDAASAIYACSESACVQYHTTHHRDFYHLCRSIRTFDQLLGADANDDYWAVFVRWLKRYRFYMLAAPLPFNWQDPQLPDLGRHMSQHIARCNVIYPQFALQAQEILNLFLKLSSFPVNPLLECLVEILKDIPEGTVAVLVKESRLIPVTEAVVQTIPSIADKNIIISSPSQFDYSRCYQAIFVIGAMSWFPKHIFTTPRANTIHVMFYRWLANKYDLGPVFVGEPLRNPYKNPNNSQKVIPQASISMAGESENLFEPEEILPTIDVNALSRRFSRSAGEVEVEDTLAQFLVLAGGMGVFVEASDQTSILIIDLDNDDDDEVYNSVQKVPLTNLLPGMFILLRTKGGGDYIVPIADKIMGAELAHCVRQSQAHWKKLLRQAVNQRGLFETCIELLDLGSQRANELNVRNWMSLRTIRPNDPDDFRAILRLVGLETDFEVYWKNTEIIFQAHRKAGFHIRKQLLQQIRKSNMQQLRKKGQMEFVLPEADGGSLTAFRIERIDPNIVKISSSHLGELLPLE